MTSNRLLPQILYADIDRYRWVSASARDLPGFAEQLAAQGIDEVVLVAPDAAAIAADLPGWGIRTTDGSSAYDIVVLERESD